VCATLTAHIHVAAVTFARPSRAERHLHLLGLGSRRVEPRHHEHAARQTGCLRGPPVRTDDYMHRGHGVLFAFGDRGGRHFGDHHWRGHRVPELAVRVLRALSRLAHMARRAVLLMQRHVQLEHRR
jgi:hypothetical protein